jgi:hypothetical protein
MGGMSFSLFHSFLCVSVQTLDGPFLEHRRRFFPPTARLLAEQDPVKGEKQAMAEARLGSRKYGSDP